MHLFVSLCIPLLVPAIISLMLYDLLHYVTYVVDWHCKPNACFVRLRPHFFAVCAPDWSQVNGSGYIEDDICTGNDTDLIIEARFVIHVNQVYSLMSSFLRNLTCH